MLTFVSLIAIEVNGVVSSSSSWSLLLLLLDEIDDTVTSSWTGRPVMSNEFGKKQGVMAPNINVDDATSSNLTGLATKAPLINCATSAPILPDAVQIPIPVARTDVANSSLVIQSTTQKNQKSNQVLVIFVTDNSKTVSYPTTYLPIVFHAAIVKHWNEHALTTIPEAWYGLDVALAKKAKPIKLAAEANTLPVNNAFRPIRSINSALIIFPGKFANAKSNALK